MIKKNDIHIKTYRFLMNVVFEYHELESIVSINVDFQIDV